MKQVAVIGGARGNVSAQDLEKAREVGKLLAQKKLVLLTGGTTGLPQAAAWGAKEAGGLSIGISPAENLREHMERYRSPTEEYDVLVFTGFGFLGRNMVLVRSADAVIAIGGGIGTLSEFTAACHAGKPVGVLKGTNGIVEKMREIVEGLSSDGGSAIRIVYSESPKKLVEKIYGMI